MEHEKTLEEKIAEMDIFFSTKDFECPFCEKSLFKLSLKKSPDGVNIVKCAECNIEFTTYKPSRHWWITLDEKHLRTQKGENFRKVVSNGTFCPECSIECVKEFKKRSPYQACKWCNTKERYFRD